MKTQLRAYIILLTVCITVPAYAVSNVNISGNFPATAAGSGYTMELVPQSSFIEKPSEGQLIFRYAVLLSVPMTTYLFAWLSWDWGDVRSQWKWAHEGWFGRNTYSGGADKLGHFYSHYLMTRLLYMVFNYTENGGYKKWIFSSLLPAFLAIGIELGDAYSSAQNGFAYQDMVCGFTGIAFGLLLERFPVVDSFVGFSVEYYPSKYFRKNMGQILRFVDDYSGWKFMVNFKLAGFRDLGLNVPVFLRYIMIDVGYYTRGFTEYDAKVGETQRKRSVFIGFSVNIMEFIDDCFRGKYPKASHYLKMPFKYIHTPLGYKFDIELDK